MLAFIVRLKTRATVLAAFAALLTGGVAAASPVGPIPSFSSHQQSPALILNGCLRAGIRPAMLA
jgi:hypothetical protein